MQPMNARYRRWKYMVQNDREISPELDAAILDTMDGDDGYISFSVSEMPTKLFETETLPCYCGKGEIVLNKLGMMEHNKIFELGYSYCFVPPMCDQCKEEN